MDWLHLAHDTALSAGFSERGNEPLGSLKIKESLDNPISCQFIKMGSTA